MGGIIALDIDGTVVAGQDSLNRDSVSRPMVDLLSSLHADGWIIFFATGRTVRWGLRHLERLPFPFFLACFNGAYVLELPSRECLYTANLFRSDVKKLAKYIEEFGAVIYESGEDGRILYTPSMFPPGILAHVRMRKERQQEHWFSIHRLGEIPADMPIASVRFFLPPESVKMLGETVSRRLRFSAPTMKDSFNPRMSIVQVASRKASKGQALEVLRGRFPESRVVIAAGDDMNDLDLLERADVRIVVEGAPEVLKTMAHHIAPAGSDAPVYEALCKAVAEYGTR